jgi:hypothetical protein
LTPIQGSIRQTIALEADEREVLRRDLRGKTMKAAADADPKLAADLERLRERLTEDAKDARDREERVASLIEKASTDLADLRRSFGL